MDKLSHREQLKLHSFWGQLLDLKGGYLKELVIKNDDNAELLSQVIKERLKIEKGMKAQYQGSFRQEELAQERDEELRAGIQNDIIEENRPEEEK